MTKVRLFSYLFTFLIVSSSFGAKVQFSKSSVRWEAAKIGGRHQGRIPIKRVKLGQGSGNLIGALVEFDISQISVDDLSSKWRTEFLKHIRGEEFFNTKKYPTATLKIIKVEPFALITELTIKSVTQKLIIPYVKEGSAESSKWSGRVLIDRTHFGMKYLSGVISKLTDRLIFDAVAISFEIYTTSGK